MLDTHEPDAVCGRAMPKPDPEPDSDLIARLAALVDEPPQGRGRRSRLTRWLTRHKDAFAGLVSVPEPNWNALARELGNAGVVDGHGNPPTGLRLRKTWWAVNRKRPTKPKVPERLGLPPVTPPH